MKKQKEPEIIRELSLDDFENIMHEIQDFRNSGDECIIEEESIVIHIYDNGEFGVSGIFSTPREYKKINI
jgi:tetrahydromethanopterin S-methyltransferase subunit A